MLLDHTMGQSRPECLLVTMTSQMPHHGNSHRRSGGDVTTGSPAFGSLKCTASEFSTDTYFPCPFMELWGRDLHKD